MDDFISVSVKNPSQFLQQTGGGLKKPIKRVGLPKPFIPAPEVKQKPVSRKTRVRSEPKRWLDF